MATTSCVDCGGTVSQRAAACPHCGAPASTRSPVAAIAGVRTVERTSKRWKLMTLVGAAMLLGSVGWVFNIGGGSDDQMGVSIALAVLLGLAGLTLLIVARFLSWWFHA